MTSANVTDVSVSVNSNITSYKSEKKSQGAKEDFMSLMAGSNAALGNLNVSQNQNSVDNSKISDITTASKVNSNSYNSAENRVTKEEPVKMDKAEVKEKIDDFAESVKDVIKEELEVTDEEIEAAMETLGLSYVDLAEPANLVALMGALEGTEDNVSLLMSDTVNNVMDAVQTLSQDLFSETGLDISELNLLAEPVVAEEIPVVTEQVNDMPKVPVVEAAANTETTETNDSDAVETLPLVNNKDNEPKAQEAPIETEDSVEDDASQALSRIVTQTKSQSQNNSGGQTSQDTGAQTNTGANTPVQTPVESNVTAHPAADFNQSLNQVTEATPEVPVYTGVNTTDVIEQIVTAARTSITAEVRSMELELNPHNLGRMLMQVSESEGQVTARFFTQNEAVKAALETAITTLIERLEEQNIKVDAVEVSVGTHEFERNLEEGFADQAREDLNESQQSNDGPKRRGGINLGDPDYMENAELTEEEQLEASIMRTYGNTVNFRA